MHVSSPSYRRTWAIFHRRAQAPKRPCVPTSTGPEPERPGPVVLGRQLMDTWDRSTDIINFYRISMVTIPFMNIYDPSQLVDDILMIEQLPLKPPLML